MLTEGVLILMDLELFRIWLAGDVLSDTVQC